MSVPPRIDSEKLLEHAAWVRALARSLVADPHLAEDLAQDTCVAALERPPAEEQNLRGWLATVLRNLQRQSARGQARRIEREWRAARAEAEPDAHDVLERAAMHRELVEAVLALGEPYRTAILLRFFDGLAPRKIASQLGVPVATVHSRVQRGLAELRGKLARHRGGDSRAWVLALIPLAERASPWRPFDLGSLGTLGPPLGALLMDAKVKVAIGIALVSCGALGIWPLVRRSPEPLDEPGVAAAPSLATIRAPSAPETLPVATDDTTSRVAAEGAVPAAREPAKPRVAAPRKLVRGLVLDVQGSPVANVRVAFHLEFSLGGARLAAAASDAHSATSDGAGRFELGAPFGDSFGEIVAVDPELATVMAGSWDSGSSLDAVVVVAPSRPLAGAVLDENGSPLAGARVAYLVDPGFEARFASALEASLPKSWQATSDEHGEFSLPDAPAIDGSHLVTSREGYVSDERPAPGRADSALEIVLLRPDFDERALEGVVVGPGGEAIEDARVALGERATLTDRRGRFSFELLEGDPADLLMALKPGFLPASMTAAPASAGGVRRWPAFATLRLGGEPLAIHGTVVDEDGDPLARVQVWIADPTWFGRVDDELAQVELLLAAAERKFWDPVVTGANGRFRLEGLLPRGYVVKAMHDTTVMLAEVGPIQAGGPPLRIVLPMRERRSVEGRVLTRAGIPLAGVQVAVHRRAVRLERDGDSWSRDATGARDVTDAAGRFELEPVPQEGVFLALGGDAIVESRFELADQEDDVRGLEVVVTARHRFQIELSEPVGRADHFYVLDEDGRELEILRIRGGNVWSTNYAELAGGRSPVLAVSEDARTLVLVRDDEEVERHTLALQPGTVNVLRF